MSSLVEINKLTEHGSLPARVLLVDDDELELSLLADRIASAGFEVVVAQNGAEALELLEAQWCPMMITDWQMPVMDGIALTQAVRERTEQDMHILMLTMRGDSLDYERGYSAGVNDYLTKKVPDPELFARIHGGFSTLNLRRSLSEARQALVASGRLDAESGVLTAAEFEAALTTEVRRSQRYQRKLALVTIGACATSETQAALSSEVLQAIALVLLQALRCCADQVGRLQAQREALFGIVLPEIGLVEVRAVAERMEVLLAKWAKGAGEPIVFSCGLAVLEDESDRLSGSATSLLAAAERCRRLASKPQ